MRATAERGSGTRLRRIEGKHNPLVKDLRQAFSRGELTEDGDCAIEGGRLVEEAIRSGLRLSAVFFRESAEDRAKRLLPQIGAHVETLVLPDKLFDSAAPSESPQGVAALVRIKEYGVEDLLERLHVGPIVVLAGLQDPGNLGTILRSAEAFGSAGVILGQGTVSPFNWKAVRASAGSLFRLPVVHGHGEGKFASQLKAESVNAGGLETADTKKRLNLNQIVKRLRSGGVRLIATSSHKGKSLGDEKFDGTVAIFFGNEGAGVPHQILAQMDETIVIPHAPQVESLNAGVAASIVLYEAATRRRS